MHVHSCTSKGPLEQEDGKHMNVLSEWLKDKDYNPDLVCVGSFLDASQQHV